MSIKCSGCGKSVQVRPKAHNAKCPNCKCVIDIAEQVEDVPDIPPSDDPLSSPHLKRIRRILLYVMGLGAFLFLILGLVLINSDNPQRVPTGFILFGLFVFVAGAAARKAIEIYEDWDYDFEAAEKEEERRQNRRSTGYAVIGTTDDGEVDVKRWGGVGEAGEPAYRGVVPTAAGDVCAIPRIADKFRRSSHYVVYLQDGVIVKIVRQIDGATAAQVEHPKKRIRANLQFGSETKLRRLNRKRFEQLYGRL